MCDFCKQIGIGMPNWDFITPDEIGMIPSGIEIEIRKCLNKPTLVFTNSANEYGAGALSVLFCPMCGRKLCDENKTPIEHFLKSEIERSESRMNVYAECFDGVHVDNETRRKLLENHIGFCKDALKKLQC